jgi:hypothetical protein
VKVLEGEAGILQGVVKQTGRHDLVPAPGLHKKTGHAHRMDNVGAPRPLPLLTPVSGCGHSQGPFRHRVCVRVHGKRSNGVQYNRLLLVVEVEAELSGQQDGQVLKFGGEASMGRLFLDKRLQSRNDGFKS